MTLSRLFLILTISRSRIRVPRFISMVITSLQLTQMVVGCLVNIWVIEMKQSGRECHVSDQVGFNLIIEGKKKSDIF